MIGLAHMAMRLACRRIYSDPGMAESIVFRPREQVWPEGIGAAAEYYRIIDRLSRGERP